MVCGNIFITLYIFKKPPHTCHVSGVTCHVSLVTCHVSPVTCHMSHFCVCGQSGEASQGRVCYQRGLLRLVYNQAIAHYFNKMHALLHKKSRILQMKLKETIVVPETMLGSPYQKANSFLSPS